MEERHPRKKQKTTRLQWEGELQQRFEKAITKLGSKATPCLILKEMNVPELSRAQVSSHLQRYRIVNDNQSYHTGNNQVFIFRDQTEIMTEKGQQSKRRTSRKLSEVDEEKDVKEVEEPRSQAVSASPGEEEGGRGRRNT